jgi:heme A synthase
MPRYHETMSDAPPPAWEGRDTRVARYAAAITATSVWVLIVVGGIVRVTESGMGCPDWPRCYGEWLPGTDLAAWIEMIHRYAAGTVSLLTAATLVAAMRIRLRAAAAFRAAGVAVVLIGVQVGIGAWTVMTGNSGGSVVAHLVMALLLLGAAVATAVWSSTPVLPSGVDRLKLTLLGAILLLAGVGGAVQVTNGGFACPSFPLCNGELWPASGGLPAELHMLHRVLAVAVGLLLAATWLRDRAARAPSPWLNAALATYALQFAVGVAQVLAGMPLALRWAHLALGAGLWGFAVAYWAATAITRPSPAATSPNRDAATARLAQQVAGGPR